MSVLWQKMDTYQTGREALFWVDDGVAEYPVYGRFWPDAPEGPVISDNNGYGYSGNAVRWAEFEPPQTMH